MFRLLVRTLLGGLLLVATTAASAPAQAATTTSFEAQLNSLGCSAGPTVGKLTPQVRSAVIRFQSANRLTQDARPDKRTRSRIGDPRAVRCDDRPVIDSGAGRRVVISQRQNYVWLVRPDGSVLAQGPMVDNTSVLSQGSFRVGSHCGRPSRVRLNSDYTGAYSLPYFVRFAPCGVGFHAIPRRRSSGAPLHPEWMLGTDLATSHGCIRLGQALAAQVWDFAVPGTRVVVR